MSRDEHEKPYIPPVQGAMHLSRFDQPTGDPDRGFADMSDRLAELAQLKKFADEKEFIKSWERYSDSIEGGRETKEYHERLQWLVRPMPKTWTDATRDYLTINYVLKLNTGLRLLKYISEHPEHEEKRARVLMTVQQLVFITDTVMSLARHAGYVKNGNIQFARDSATARWAEAVAYPNGEQDKNFDISSYFELSHEETFQCWRDLFSGRAHRFYSTVFEQKDTRIPGLYYSLARALNLSNLIQTELLVRTNTLELSVQQDQAAQLFLDYLLGEQLEIQQYQTVWESQLQLGMEVKLTPEQVGEAQIAPDLLEYLDKTLRESRFFSVEVFLMALVSNKEPFLQNEENTIKLIDNILFWKALKKANHPQINQLQSFQDFCELAEDIFPYIQKYPEFREKFEGFLARFPGGHEAFNRIIQ
jgi:hypothetical protein